MRVRVLVSDPGPGENVMRIVLVTGTRERLTPKGEGFVRAIIRNEKPELSIVGDCPTGVDKIASDLAEIDWGGIAVFAADWNAHGRAAGPKRNGEMVKHAQMCLAESPSHTVTVLAFPVAGSKGTRDCIKQALAAGLQVKEFDVTQHVDNTPPLERVGSCKEKGTVNMAFGAKNQASGQSLSRSAGGGDRRAPLSRLMGDATMGSKRLSNIPLGKARIRIEDTKQAQKSQALIVEGVVTSILDDEADYKRAEGEALDAYALAWSNLGTGSKVVRKPDESDASFLKRLTAFRESLPGTKVSRVFKFGGESKGQPEARTAEWCRFVVAVAGVESLPELEEAGECPYNILDRSTLERGQLHPDETLPEDKRSSRPLLGLEVDVETIDTGKVTAANPKTNYAGGDPIHDNYWAPVGTLIPATEAA